MRSALRAGLAALLLAIFGQVTTVAAQGLSVDSIKQKGSVTVGIMIDVPPFAILDANNQPDGYDIEIAKILCERLKVTCDMVALPGASRIPYLLTGKVDFLVAVLGIIPSRAKQVAFSRPYAGFCQFLYVKKELDVKEMKDSGRPHGRRAARQYRRHHADQARPSRHQYPALRR